MSKRILMRLGKSPFEVKSIWDNIESSAFGANNGNLVFGYAAHKLLSVSGTEVVANRYQIHPDMADQVNAEYDGFVLPLANAFRPSFQGELRRTTAFIERLRIPFMMLSGGAQLPLDGNPAALRPIEEDVKSFARAVLDRSPALSVRGVKTAEYLASIGIHDVVVVGCPSLTLHGPGHSVQGIAQLPEDARVAYNIETSKDIEPTLIRDIDSRFDATYFPQDQKTLEGMLWGTDPYHGRTDALPLGRSHKQFTSGKAEYWPDAPSWIARLSEFDISIGSRIHGNIAAILAGTPALLLAHDSRTLELADHHAIPVQRVIPGNDSSLRLEDLVDGDAFRRFNQIHSSNFRIMSDFIHDAGFAHIHEEARQSDRDSYAEALAAVSFAEPITDVTSRQTPEELGGLRMLKKADERHSKTIGELKQRERRITSALGGIRKRHESEVEALSRELDAARSEIAVLTAAVAGLTESKRSPRRRLWGSLPAEES